MLISAILLRLLASSLAPARTARMRPLQHASLLGIEAQVIAPLVEIGDAGEKLTVEIERASGAAPASA